MRTLSSIKKYKNAVTRKYIFLAKEDIDIIDSKKDWWVSKKIDGQLWFYVKAGKETKIINSNENDITQTLPDILKDLDKKFKSFKSIIVAGELYYLTDKRERYGDVIAGLGDKTKNKNLRYGIFDIVSSDQNYASYEDKYKVLTQCVGHSSKDFAHAVEQQKTKQKDISTYFKDHIEKHNFEGLIVRDSSTIYKIKNEETADLLITGYTLGSKPGQVRSVSLGVYLNDQEIVHVGSCGAFENEKLRKDLFNQLSKIKVPSNFQKIASNGTAYLFVKPQYVAEVKLLELQADKSNDQPIRHLKFEFKNKQLNATGRARSVSVLNSKIVGLRPDKKAMKEDCGLNQITKLSGIPKEEFTEVTLSNLPKSKIMKKEIFVKEGKNGKAIKKFNFWKSNKEKIGDYPSYLFYYLDYSEGRKDPIKKKIYPFADEKLGLGFFQSVKEENIKKGWEAYGS